MEAKDTVVHGKDCIQPFHNLECHRGQAEIAFKAGIEEAQRRLHGSTVRDIVEDELKQAELRGIREVVRFIEKYNHRGIRVDGKVVVQDSVLIEQPEWQAQKKEWGIK